jgi:hypothetical protein
VDESKPLLAGATSAAGVSTATTSAVTYVSDTEATCGVPAGDPATLHDFALGGAVQVDPITSTLQAPGSKRLIL